MARAQADRSLDELAQWFDLSPTGMLVFDEALTSMILATDMVRSSSLARPMPGSHRSPAGVKAAPRAGGASICPS